MIKKWRNLKKIIKKKRKSMKERKGHEQAQGIKYKEKGRKGKGKGKNEKRMNKLKVSSKKVVKEGK